MTPSVNAPGVGTWIGVLIVSSLLSAIYMLCLWQLGPVFVIPGIVWIGVTWLVVARGIREDEGEQMTARRRPRVSERGYGEGSIYPLDKANPDGKWIAAVTIGWVGDKRKYARRVGVDQADADRLRKQLLGERDSGEITSATTVTEYVSTYLDKNLPARRSKGKPLSQATIDNYKCVAKAHIYPRIGNKKLKDLKAEHVERLLLEPMAKEGGPTGDGLSRNTIMRAQSVLKMALDQALALWRRRQKCSGSCESARGCKGADA